MLTASWAYPHTDDIFRTSKTDNGPSERGDLLALRLKHIGIFFYVLKT